MYTKIIGTGSYLPEQVRTNADLEKMVETTDEWIVTRTGIRERRIAAANETVATMGFEAAKKALEMANVNPEQIGLIVVATTSGTHAFPSSACQIQSMLGVKGCPALTSQPPARLYLRVEHRRPVCEKRRRRLRAGDRR